MSLQQEVLDRLSETGATTIAALRAVMPKVSPEALETTLNALQRSGRAKHADGLWSSFRPREPDPPPTRPPYKPGPRGPRGEKHRASFIPGSTEGKPNGKPRIGRPPKAKPPERVGTLELEIPAQPGLRVTFSDHRADWQQTFKNDPTCIVIERYGGGDEATTIELRMAEMDELCAWWRRAKEAK